jgi:hypothetical protein
MEIEDGSSIPSIWETVVDWTTLVTAARSLCVCALSVLVRMYFFFPPQDGHTDGWKAGGRRRWQDFHNRRSCVLVLMH